MPSAQPIGSSTTCLRVWNESVGERGGCTLLGPEGPEPLVPSFWASSCFLAVVGMRRGYRPYFENYTVDASIFKESERQVFQKGSVGSCDFKSLRADGGCLGIWSRRRT